jgi:hypothetical protein
MKKFLLLFFCMAMLSGCKKPDGKWEALQDVPVFKEADETDELKFILRKGDICALGEERIVKAFMYRKIECSQGTGWITYQGGYPLKKID